MLLLGHPLTALLDDGAHGTTFGLARHNGKRAYSPQPPVLRAQGSACKRLPPPAPCTRRRSLPRGRSRAGGLGDPVRPPAASGQLAATKASLRYCFTACSGTRKERPTRMAS